MSASAEVLEPRTHTRLIGRASDVGMGGCYIDTVSPFPVGTAVFIRLASGSRAIKAKGNVVYAFTGMGMGISFAEVNAEEGPKLAAWLREISGEDAGEPQEAGQLGSGVGEPFASGKPAGLAASMRELLTLLENKRVLSDEEVEFLREKMGE